jgi:hypothetical protein
MILTATEKPDTTAASREDCSLWTATPATGHATGRFCLEAQNGRQVGRASHLSGRAFLSERNSRKRQTNQYELTPSHALNDSEAASKNAAFLFTWENPEGPMERSQILAPKMHRLHGVHERRSAYNACSP